MRFRSLLLSVALSVAGAVGAGGCGDSAPRTAADSQAAHIRDVVAAGGVVDSILPIAEHLRRFRATISEQPDTLRNASATRDALVDRWAGAVAASDTSALNNLLLDRAEFAWLYYPTSRLSQPPYEAPPELLWGQLLASSNKGATDVLRQFGGQSLRVTSLRCEEPVQQEGSNRLFDKCIVTVKPGTSAQTEGRLFGTIIERDGRFKFIGYANAM